MVIRRAAVQSTDSKISGGAVSHPANGDGIVSILAQAASATAANPAPMIRPMLMNPFRWPEEPLKPLSALAPVWLRNLERAAVARG